MLAVSTKTRYSLIALYELALQYDELPVQSRVISEKYALSQAYLEQLFNALKCAGIVKSFRGSQGGYRLARPPHQITVLDIVQVFEGEFQLTDPDKKGPLMGFWMEMDRELKQQLRVTLQELTSKYQQQGSMMYAI